MSDLAAVAAAAGAGFAFAKPIAETVSELSAKLLGRPLEVAGDLLGDHIYLQQCMCRMKILEKVYKQLDSRGLPPSLLPPGFALSAIDSMGNAAEEELQELWAKLIASAVADEANAKVGYSITLRAMDSSDAKLFETVCNHVSTNELGSLHFHIDFESHSYEASLIQLESLDLMQFHGSFSDIYPFNSLKSGTSDAPLLLVSGSLRPYGFKFAQAIGLLSTSEN